MSSPTIAKIGDERLNNDFYLIVYYYDDRAYSERKDVINELESFKFDEDEIKIINKNNINNIKVLHTANRKNNMSLNQMVKTKLYLLEENTKAKVQRQHK